MDGLSKSQIVKIVDMLYLNVFLHMNPSHFSQDFINKWNNWKDAVEANQHAFYMLTIDES